MNRAPPDAIDSANVRRSAPLRVEIANDWPEGWARCAAAAEARSLFLGPTWIETFSRHFADARLRILASFERGAAEPAYLLPLFVEAGEASAFANYYVSAVGMVGPDDPRTMCRHARALVDALAQWRPRLTGVRLQPLLYEGHDYRALHAAFRAAGWIVEEFFGCGNWRLDTAGARYDDYFAGLPGALRSTITRKRKKLLKAGGDVEIHRTPADVSAHLAAYEAVYRQSWKVREDREDFVRDMALAFAREGAMRLGAVRLDDRIIASQIWIVRNGTASIYKLAYDEDYSALSAGTVLSDAMFRTAFDEDGVHTVDYLTGDDAYKRDWMRERREFWGLYAHNPATARGAVRGLRTMAKRVIRVLRAGTPGRRGTSPRPDPG